MHPVSPDPDDWPESSTTDWIAEEISDAEDFLARQVASAMADDPAISNGRIEISVQNGVVIIAGHVGDCGIRSAAAHRAWAVPGVFDVCNLLTISDV